MTRREPREGTRTATVLARLREGPMTKVAFLDMDDKTLHSVVSYLSTRCGFSIRTEPEGIVHPRTGGKPVTYILADGQ